MSSETLRRTRYFYGGSWHPKRKFKKSSKPDNSRFPYKLPILFEEEAKLFLNKSGE